MSLIFSCFPFCSFSQYHYLLYYLFPAMHPRMLFTVAPASQCSQPGGASASLSSTEETEGKGGASTTGADVAMASASHDKTEEHAKDEKMDGEEEAGDGADIAEEELKMVCIPARVGEAVDIVGQVGRQPKTITAFQTHTTPVLLSYSERAELASDEYVPLAKVLEGVVILKKNPDYKAPKNA
ncbi:26s proteasome non-atpase regulatory subunit [Cystoisospora suis]|uniref:26s proteasome non-atpase regulatory subunit n=1 Tax=Cystoisospora suis TaxID=483139 RepID=A0A2C6L931_9APIC|nr:26s proteasome non-atpase regulatory subunit [Cystoisospora suis]